jgi:dinuclear metal center YbgI/SA1388 family protein
MRIQDVASAIEGLLPPGLAQSWDNVGLLVGDRQADARRILVTIDTTHAVAAEAKRLKVDLIISYHPIIWDGLKRITADGPTAVLYDLIRSGIAVYSIHTSLDVIAGGVNDGLAAAIGLVDAEPIGDFVEDPAGPQYKIVTFVPPADVAAVAEALYQAGAGAIGRYSHCGFQTSGTGTFLPLEGSRPAIGRVGRVESVSEIRLETVVASGRIAPVLAALRKAHPYETPAFDVLRHHDVEQRLGLGRMGRLERPAPVRQVLARIKKATGAKAAGIIGSQDRTVNRAAVCAGACGKILQRVCASDCDLYLTGELKHHEALAAQEAGLTVVCLSHTVSERFSLAKLVRELKKALPRVTIRQSAKDADPFEWKML